MFLIIISTYYLFKNNHFLKKSKEKADIEYKKIENPWKTKKDEFFYIELKILNIKLNIDSKKINSKSLSFYKFKNTSLNFNEKNIYKSNIWIKNKNIKVFCSNKYIYFISTNRSEKYVYKYSQILEIIFVNRKKLLLSFKSNIRNKPIFINFKKSKDMIYLLNFLKKNMRED